MTSSPAVPPFNWQQPCLDKKQLRRQLQQERLNMANRAQRIDQLQTVLRLWLATRREKTIGAYWAIKGEFDALPALFRWWESTELETKEQRRIGLPVINSATKQLTFHVWYPGCPMEEDAYGIPKPKDTEAFHPELLLVPCVGFGPGGYRLGYGGGFYDRTLSDLQPRPVTVGVAFDQAFVPWLKPEPHDMPLDIILTNQGVVYNRDE